LQVQGFIKSGTWEGNILLKLIPLIFIVYQRLEHI